MLNSVKFVLTLILTAASAVSCVKEIVVQGEETGELMLNPQVDALTKAPIAGTMFPDTRTIVLSAYNNIPGGTSMDFFQNITFAKDAVLGSWTGGTSPEYWPVAGTLDLLAYSADGFTPALTPAYNSTNCSADVTLTVPDNSAAQVDILWAGAQGKVSSPTALAMTFKHAESSVAFNAKAQVPYDATANLGITIDKITLEDVNSSGKVKLPIDGDCTWSDLGTPMDIDLPDIPTGGYNVTGNYIDIAAKPFAIGETGIIVIPQAATSFTVNYTVHYGRDVSSNPVDKPETFSYTIPSTISWVAGTKYVYNLDFKQDQILVATDIYDWTDSPSGVPVQEPVSATFLDPVNLSIDLGAATLSAGGVVGIDWGYGRRQIIENTSTSSATSISELPHTYSTLPTDSVKIYVRKGVLDFGIVSKTHYDCFHVYNNDEVKMQTAQFSLTLSSADKGTVTLSYPPAGTIAEGETKSVYQKEKVTVNAVPDTHYVIDNIKYNDGTDHDITDATSFAMPGANTSVSVTFKNKAYRLTADTPANGSFTFSGASGSIASGSDLPWDTEITVVPVPAAGYVVDKVQYTCGGSTTEVTPASSVYKFKMPTGDTSVTVTFKIEVPGDSPLDDYDIETVTIS